MSQTVRTFKLSFAGGEVTPEFYGRVDDIKNQVGLGRCRNFFIKPHGPASNRAGTQFVKAAKYSDRDTRVIGFVYSDTETFAVEIGDQYMRFHTYGATLQAGAPDAYDNATAYATGDLVTYAAAIYYCTAASTGNLPTDTDFWYALPADGTYEIQTPYAAADVFDLHYVQSKDVLTIVHPSYAPAELRRYGATNWQLAKIDFTPQISPPTTVSAKSNAKGKDYVYKYVVTTVSADGLSESLASTPARGTTINITSITQADPGVVTTTAAHGLAAGDSIIFAGLQGMVELNDNTYVVATVPTTTTFTFSDAAGNVIDTSTYTALATATQHNITNVSLAKPCTVTTSAAHGLAAGDSVFVDETVSVKGLGMTYSSNSFGSSRQLNGSFYTVGSVPSTTTFTLLDSKGNPIDTSASEAYASGGVINPPNHCYKAGVTNNLYQTGGANTISWEPVQGAKQYRVYKYSVGVYGYIGATEGTIFTDDNIAADISTTPPLYDQVFQSADAYPSAVSYYDQRRDFGGTNALQQNMWMTRVGTESDLSYSIPSRDVDGISFKLAALKANKIRHIVPLNDLLVLTSSGVWKVTSVNSDSITPTSIALKPQAYVGASNVQPVTAGDSVLFEAERGHHVREIRLNITGTVYSTKDLSLRAPHLFDGYRLKDETFTEAPYPIYYAASTSGKLLGMTYVPEEDVNAWFWYDSYTNGGQFDEIGGVTEQGEMSVFQSVTAVPEGDEDAVYAVVQREINGSTVQYIERFASRNYSQLQEAFFVDCGVYYDGNPKAIAGITQAAPGVATVIAHGYANGDVVDFDEVEGMTDVNGQRYYVANKTDDTFELNDEYGTAIDTTTFGAYARGGVSRSVISGIAAGISHLEGEKVAILGDGAVQPKQVVTGGAITFDTPVSRASIGLPVEADLESLPLAYQMEAFAQGRAKNVNDVWLRVYQSSGIFAGPSFDMLVEKKQRTTEPFGSPPDVITGEYPLKLKPRWSDEGVVCIRQSAPLPFTLTSMTLEVEIAS